MSEKQSAEIPERWQEVHDDWNSLFPRKAESDIALRMLNEIAALDAIRKDLVHALECRRENHESCVINSKGDRRCKNCLYDDALLARAREFDKE